jgi:hypothetical protein
MVFAIVHSITLLDPVPNLLRVLRYTAPGSPDMEPVVIALGDPMRVDRAAQ